MNFFQWSGIKWRSVTSQGEIKSAVPGLDLLFSTVDTHQPRFKLFCNKIGGKLPLASDGDVDGLISLNERMFSTFEVQEEHSKCIDATQKIVKFWIDVKNESKNDCHYLLGKVFDNTVNHIHMIQLLWGHH